MKRVVGLRERARLACVLRGQNHGSCRVAHALARRALADACMSSTPNDDITPEGTPAHAPQKSLTQSPQACAQGLDSIKCHTAEPVLYPIALGVLQRQ